MSSRQLYMTETVSEDKDGNDHEVDKDNRQVHERRYQPTPLLQPPIHHTAIKTRNITTAIQFYSLLGYTNVTKFRAGPARAAWLRHHCPSIDDQQHQDENDATMPTTTKGTSGSSIIELIEVPSWILKERPKTRSRAVDLLNRQDLLGLNHIALDVTNSAQRLAMSRKIQDENNDNSGRSGEEVNTRLQPVQGQMKLKVWMDELNTRSLEEFGKTVRVGLEPFQQIIGNTVYELAFVYDPDGMLIEFVLQSKTLNQQVSSGWDPIVLDENNKDINNDGQEFWKV